LHLACTAHAEAICFYWRVHHADRGIGNWIGVEAMTPEQTLDWLAEQHKSQCNEDRPVQEWIRSMKSMLPTPVQEPVAGQCRFPNVAWSQCDPAHVRMVLDNPHEWKGYEVRYLYTTPPAAQRQWVGLTQEEREQHRDDWRSNIHDKEFRAIEAKLKEKNT
jgi:hypothetical protein